MRSDRCPRSLLYPACLAGILISLTGRLLESRAILRFLSAHVSSDGVIDTYTAVKVQGFAAGLLTAGPLVPLIAIASCLLLHGPVVRRRTATALSVIAAASLCLCFLWLAYIPPYGAAALRSKPDEIQYVIPAVNLLERGRLVMVMNGREFPPITPVGFHLILLPFYRAFGTMIGNGIRAVQAGALVSILGTCLLGAIVLGKKRGLLAALLLAANPCFVFWSRGIMPTTANLALNLVTLLIIVQMASRSPVACGSAWAGLLGLITGVQIFISFSYAYVAPVIFLVMLAVLKRGRGGARLAGCALAFGAGACAALLPQLLYQRAAYGGIFKTGYYAWFWAMPGGQPLKLPYAFARRSYDIILLELLGALGWDTRINGLTAISLDLAGLGELYNLATFALILVGLWFARARASVGGYRTLLLFLAVFLAFNIPAYALSLFDTTRYFLQVVPLLLLLCADGFCSGFERARGRYASLKRLVLCLLLAFSLAGAAGRVRERLSEDRALPAMYALSRAHGEIAGEGAAVVSEISGAYLCHFLPEAREITWIPLSRKSYLLEKGGRLLFPPVADRPEALDQFLREGRPVYIDDWGEARRPEEYRKLRERLDFDLVKSVPGGGIFRLRPKPGP